MLLQMARVGADIVRMVQVATAKIREPKHPWTVEPLPLEYNFRIKLYVVSELFQFTFKFSSFRYFSLLHTNDY